jgi:glucose-6-phosphate isomerase
MTESNIPLTERSQWKALLEHYDRIKGVHLRELFRQDPDRGRRMALEACDLYLDFSKNRLTDETIRLLVKLAESVNLRQRIEDMFTGRKINITETRAVLHVALRAPQNETIIVDGENVVPQVHAVLRKMRDFSSRVRSGSWKGYTGKPMKNIINIGIGGSDLGPAMAYEALRPFSDRNIQCQFVSNIDSTALVEATRVCNA